jgi:peptidoglycan/LPS O-acetylase OafA/YrhL
MKESMLSKRWETVSSPDQEFFQPKFRGHITELDGLRAVGLSFVLFHHFSPSDISLAWFQLGNLGWIAMDSFFVMSGFLITGILLDSRDKPSFYRTYYARRALRIFPLYYAVLLIWWVIGRFGNHGIDWRHMITEWGSPIWFWFYVGNIRVSMMQSWPRIVGYGPLWSLQIEEQYYLLFPFAVALLRREHLRRLLIAAVFISPLFRLAAYWWQPENRFLQYVLLPCHCEGLALGGLIAMRFRSGPWHISKKVLSILTAILLGATCIGSLWSTWGTRNEATGSDWDRLAGYSISSLACACLILWLICFRDSSWTSWLRSRPLQYLGKISYGVYLLQTLGYWIMMDLAKKQILHFKKNDPVFFIECVGVTLVLAALSWHFFERPLLKIKDRIPYARANPVAVGVDR